MKKRWEAKGYPRGPLPEEGKIRDIVLMSRWLEWLERQCGRRSIARLRFHPEQFPLLDLVYRQECRSQADLANRLRVSPASVAVSVKRLARAGLIEKQADSNDLRSNIITITPEGEEVVLLAKEGYSELKTRQYEGFTEEELDQMLLLTKRMGENLEKYREQLDERA